MSPPQSLPIVETLPENTYRSTEQNVYVLRPSRHNGGIQWLENHSIAGRVQESFVLASGVLEQSRRRLHRQEVELSSGIALQLPAPHCDMSGRSAIRVVFLEVDHHVIRRFVTRLAPRTPSLSRFACAIKGSRSGPRVY